MNRYVKGKIEIGRIDLTTNCSFFEVPEQDADMVLKKMAKASVGDRKVVVDSADHEPQSAGAGIHKERRRRSDKEIEVKGDRREMKAEWKAERKSDRKSDRRSDRKSDNKAKGGRKPERKGGKKGGRYEDAELFDKKSKKKDDWRQFFQD